LHCQHFFDCHCGCWFNDVGKHLLVAEIVNFDWLSNKIPNFHVRIHLLLQYNHTNISNLSICYPVSHCKYLGNFYWWMLRLCTRNSSNCCISGSFTLTTCWIFCTSLVLLICHYVFGLSFFGTLIINSITIHNNSTHLLLVQMWVPGLLIFLDLLLVSLSNSWCLDASLLVFCYSIRHSIDAYQELIRILLMFYDTDCDLKSIEIWGWIREIQIWLDQHAPCMGKPCILPMLLLFSLVWLLMSIIFNNIE